MFLALLAAAFQTTAYIGPLAPAGNGMAQCYAPNKAQKTCASMATYHQNADGSFTSKSLILISKSPQALLEMNTRVAVRNGAVCGTIQESDITSAKLTVSDTEVAPDQAKPVLAQIAQGMAGIIGHEICTSYMKSGSGVMAKSTIDGVPKPEQDQVVLWVSPADGYTVAP